MLVSSQIHFPQGDCVPTPIGINDDFTVDVSTAASSFACTSLPGHFGVNFGRLLADDPGRGAGGPEGQYCGRSRSDEHLLLLMKEVRSKS